MPEPIRLLEGPGVDAAAAKLRATGLEVQIIAPTKTLQLWRYIDLYAALVDAGSESSEADAIRDEMDGPWFAMGEDARALWRRLLDALHRHPWIDPEIVELMDGGERVRAPIQGLHEQVELSRDLGRWLLGITHDKYGGVQARQVSDRFAAAWLAEFDGGDDGR